MKKIYIRNSTEIIRKYIAFTFSACDIMCECSLNTHNNLFSVSISLKEFIENKSIIEHIIKNIKINFPEFEIKIL